MASRVLQKLAKNASKLHVQSSARVLNSVCISRRNNSAFSYMPDTAPAQFGKEKNYSEHDHDQNVNIKTFKFNMNNITGNTVNRGGL